MIPSILISGKELNVHFGLMALKYLGEKQDLLKKESDEGTVSLLFCYHVIYAGYMNWSYFMGKAPEMTFGEIAQIVDKLVISEPEKVRQLLEELDKAKSIMGESAESVNESTTPDKKKKARRKPLNS